MLGTGRWSDERMLPPASLMTRGEVIGCVSAPTWSLRGYRGHAADPAVGVRVPVPRPADPRPGARRG
jgi:hypothetical protein